jgi:GTP-binding protein Era
MGEEETRGADEAAEPEAAEAGGRADYRSGYVALVGRPNAGKSTLLNRLVGEKIAAVSNKPQTTRHQIRGVITRPEGQVVLVDTPGVHQPGYLLNRRMMAAVHDALEGVDLVCLIRDASVSTGNGDRFVLDLVRRAGKPSILLLNKTDKLEDKRALLPLIEWYSSEHEWRGVVPLSARTGDQLADLIKEFVANLPAGEPVFGDDELTDQPMRSLVAEMVREKILHVTGEEIPYVTAVVTERYEEVSEGLARIYCAVYVERASQKSIIIGKGGARLKQVGTEARRDIERLVGHRVYLELFVKVEEDWRNSPRALSEMGIEGREP